MFLGEGKRALLEFLRNLTPQILFLTLAIIFSTKLDLETFDFSFEGVKRSFAFVMCLLVFIGAWVANMSSFIESVLKSPEELEKIAAEIRCQKIAFWKRTWMLFCANCRCNKLVFFEVALVVVITHIALGAVFFSAVQSAVVSPLVYK
ncbi:hypothetical protein [Pseudomonas fluorescens]|uniref:hypothetical protein n=1 Tax=Pseudomonas TaxID=286 RepID=UPI003D00C472